MQHAAVSACSTVLAANPKAHTQRHINVRHSAEMMLEMIYSYVFFFPTLRDRSEAVALKVISPSWQSFGRYLLNQCAAGEFHPFLPFLKCLPCGFLSHDTDFFFFLSLSGGCCSSGSISMTDLIYPSRIQRGPRWRERELQ